MPHSITLISTIAVGLGLALVFGFLATRLRLPALVGYLIAGILIGPGTPGFVADIGLSQQLAEIGVILLMFGVGLHFSLNDLLAVRRIALPGAVVQIAAATGMGMATVHFWGWSLGAGIVFGLALSVASTVVLLRALEDRGLLDSLNGRIAVGWLIVEDLAMVLVLVLLPPLAGVLGGSVGDVAGNVSGGMAGEAVVAVASEVAGKDAAAGIAPGIAADIAGTSVLKTLAITFGEVAVFVVLMLVVGRRVFPWLLGQVARTGSRELFTLCVIAAAVGVAYGSAKLFGVSFALGAFFAGMMLRESPLSHRAAEESLPLRDAFAVLFFVSVGMLFEPTVLIEQPLHVLATVAIIVVGKSLAAFVIVLLFRYPLNTALTVSASLAQIGEFSFILVGLGVTLELLPKEGQSLVLAGALISISINPLIFHLIEPLQKWIRARSSLARLVERSDDPLAVLPMSVDATRLTGHIVLVGYGRVGKWIGDVLTKRGLAFVVAEQNRETVEALRARGIPAVSGDAAEPAVLIQAHIARARMLVIATPEILDARSMIDIARMLNPGIETVVRTHSEEEAAALARENVGKVFIGEHELASGMTRHILERSGQRGGDGSHPH